MHNYAISCHIVGVTFYHLKWLDKDPINYDKHFDDLTFRITLECGRSMSGHLST